MKNNFDVEEHAIIEIIQKEKIAHQQELVEKLKKRGLSVPQSTLSRKLKKLGIVKIHNIYKILESDRKNHLPVHDIKLSPPNLLVLHTLPGYANSLAIYLDSHIQHSQIKKSDSIIRYSSLIGTIAGDDTVLVIADGSRKGLSKLKEEIEVDFHVTLSRSL